MSTYERCKVECDRGRKKFVAPEHGPLKKLNKEAIEFADSHGAATTRSGTGSETEALAEHGVLHEGTRTRVD